MSNKRTAEQFIPPSTSEELYCRVVEQLPEALKRFADENFQGQPKGEKLVNKCKRFFPCQDQQKFEDACALVETALEYYLEGQRETSVLALMELEEDSVMLESRGGRDSSVYPQQHLPATTTSRDFVLKPISLTNDVMASLNSSIMATLRNQKNRLYYYREADVQHFVQRLLVDASAVCNAIIAEVWTDNNNSSSSPMQVDYRLEPSIWSEKPDHTVVFDTLSGSPLLTVEVKKPTPKKLDAYERVLGQSFDYLNISKVQGHSGPIHITTTLKESFVAWLPDNDFVDRYNSTCITEMKALWTKIICSQIQSRGSTKMTQSLVRVEQYKSTTSASTATTINSPEVRRSFYTSQPFKLHQLFPVMVNSIMCSLNGSARSRSIPRLCKGDTVRQIALGLNSKGYFWENIDVCVDGPFPKKTSFFQRPLHTLKNVVQPTTYYVVGVVGLGATSRAFRVVTKSGYEGVAKVYVRKYDEERKLPYSKKDFDKNAEQSVSRELVVFQNTYPDMPVSREVFYGHKGLLMPFFTPVICVDDNDPGFKYDDPACLEDKIKEQLRCVRSAKSCLCYKETDMRWRHIGFDTDKNVRVFDFNDMEEIENSEVESRANIHWKTLLSRLPGHEDEGQE